MKLTDALDQLARGTKAALTRMAQERAFAAGAPFLLAVGLWAAAALSGLHGWLPPLLQSLTALLALALVILLFVRARRAYRAPTLSEARGRLAQASHLDAGAFEALSDHPVRFDPGGAALWRRAQEHARARADDLRPDFVLQRLDGADPYKLRYVIPAILIVAAAFAGAEAPDRLARAFLPDPGPLLGDQPMAVEAWVAPAAYTHAAPISLSDRLGERIATPPSVEAMVRLTGPVGAPRLVFEGPGVRTSVRFTRAVDGAWEARLAIPRAGTLKIVRFHSQGFWRLRPAADNAPNVRFEAPIALMPREAAQIAWRADDDFGIARVAFRVRPVDPPVGLRRADPIDTPLESPAGDPRGAEGQTQVQLGPHPYAGMEVEARIIAVDALGQVGESAPMRFVMPEKVFLNTVAQAAIEIRRQIQHERRPYRRGNSLSSRRVPAGDILLGRQRIEIRDPVDRPPLRRAPPGVRTAARYLDSLTIEPQDRYFRDLAVFLGLKLARAEMENALAIEETDLAAETLWLTALRAEYGGSSDARTALEAARRALSEALRDHAPRERIEQLMQALRDAASRYLDALVQEAMRQDRQQTQEDTEEQTQITGQDLEEMFDEIDRLNRQGRNQEADAMLDQLADILSNLGVELAEGGEGESGESGEGQLEESLDQLSEAMGEQRALNDETQQQSEDGESPDSESQDGGGGQGDQQNGQGGGALSERQANIREQVGEAQQNAGEAGASQSENLDNAQRAMREAENALARGDLEGARASQDAALEALRQSADGMAMELRERANAQAQGRASGPSDPLGRRMPSSGAGNDETEVPSEFTPARAREIMDEIRRRAQDQNRPEAEREYLRRLLDRFSGS